MNAERLCLNHEGTMPDLEHAGTRKLPSLGPKARFGILAPKWLIKEENYKEEAASLHGPQTADGAGSSVRPVTTPHIQSQANHADQRRPQVFQADIPPGYETRKPDSNGGGDGGGSSGPAHWPLFKFSVMNVTGSSHRHSMHSFAIHYRTTSTGQFAYCTTRVDTLPRRIRSMALSPLAPITIISACCLAAIFIISSAGSPIL